MKTAAPMFGSSFQSELLSVEIESSSLKTYQREKGLAAGLDRGASHTISLSTAITSGVAALFLVSHLKRVLIEAI